MRLTSIAMALLLCAYSFFAGEAHGNRLAQMREAWRATVTKVGGVSNTVKSTAGITLTVIALCTGMLACDRTDYPNFVDTLVVADNVPLVGVSSAEAQHFTDSDAWFHGEDFDNLLVAYQQGKAMGVGVANTLEGLDKNELVVNDPENSKTRSIINSWQVKGVWLENSKLENKYVEVNTENVVRRLTSDFSDDKAARKILWNKDSKIIGEITQVFIEVGGDGDKWFLLTPKAALGVPPRKDLWLDLGIRRLDGQLLYLFVHESDTTTAQPKQTKK